MGPPRSTLFLRGFLMRKFNLIAVFVVALSLMAFGVAMAADEAPAEPTVIGVGMKATDLQLKNAEGQAVDLANEMKGKTRVLVFMNTSCSACKTELTHIQKILRSSDAELVVVSVDFGSFDKVQAYKDTNKFGGTWYQDEDFNVPAKFGFDFTPAAVILDGEGKVLYSTGGYNKRNAKKFEAELKKVL